MPRSHHRNRRPSQQRRVAACPEHRWWIVNLAQTFWILRARIAHQRSAQRSHTAPFFFSCAPTFTVEQELCRRGGKSESFEGGERHRKYLARRLELLHSVQNPLGSQSRSQRQRKPRQPVFIQLRWPRSFGIRSL